MNIRLHSETVAHPPPQEPLWAPKVDRWYQLDEPAYCLTQFVWSIKEKTQKPEGIVLACEGASNQSDTLFASQGATSAQRFSHTLPNVRASSVLQMMDWHGPLVCLQKDPFTLACALQQAPILFPGKLTWILNYCPSLKTCTLIECDGASQHFSSFFSIAGVNAADLNKPNTALINWLRHIEKHPAHR